MKTALTIVGAVVIVSTTAWGYFAPALELRRRGELRSAALLSSYWSHVRRIPASTATALARSMRHPWSYDGIVFGHLLFVAVLLLGTASAVVYAVIGPDRTETATWAALFAVLAVGNGIVVVRDLDRATGRRR